MTREPTPGHPHGCSCGECEFRRSNTAIPGEPVWPDGRRKRLSLVMESLIEVEEADLGEADRPSEVARLLRKAADEIEATVREGLAARLAAESTEEA